MKIVTLERQHMEEAAVLSLASYQEEARAVEELPQAETIPGLEELAENGLGVAAMDRGKMVGFLGCYPPFSNAFGSTDVTGVFSPMGANAAVRTDRAKIYAAMYQEAGKRWVKAGAVSHALCLYAHDQELQRQFYRYGFGLRCVDAIRPMKDIVCEPCPGYTFAELTEKEIPCVYPLHLALDRHFRESPIFMNRKSISKEEFLAASGKREGDKTERARYFAARPKEQGEICAYLRISPFGETFAAAGASYRHIDGAYCLPEKRGRGLFPNLLQAAVSVLRAEGYTRLGVDFESFNPTACGFWLKYFTAYTHGVVRRVDERILLLENRFV